MGINSNRVEHFSDPSCPEATVTMPPPLELHRVCLPPHKTTLQKFRDRVSEIFFPDDPLHRFKNQTWIRKLVLGLQFFFPVFQWGPSYGLNLLRSDIISGLTIASLAIPQGISYAKLANLPPIIGLYSSFVPPLIYSVLGSSRHLGVGPVSIASLVMGTMLSETVSYSEQPILYLQLAFTATFFAGVFQAFSRPTTATLVGFMAGAAIIVSLQQLKGLLGIVHFTSKMQIVPVLLSVFRQKNEWSWQTIVMGTSFLVFLLTTRKISMRKPKLFWISAAAPLTSVILSTILVYLLRSKLHGVSTIGHLPKGLNPPSSNMLFFAALFGGCDKNQPYNRNTLPHRIAVGRTFAALKNYQVDGNKEMMAIGLMNMAGSCSSCYVTTGSFSRSAVNYNAGAQTVVSNVIMAATVLVTLLFLMPLFSYTPSFILAAIIITAVIGLIDYQAAIRLWKVDKLDFVACLCSFLGVLFISVPLGLAIAVGVSVFKILLHVTRPNTVVLGNIPGTQIYQNLSRYREASRVPSFLILAVESPIYFANSTYLQERILRWVREEEERVDSNKESAMKCIILDMTVGTVMEKLHQSNVLQSFGLNGLYLTVGEAVADISSPWKA
ncbi:sulfate transporter 3;4 [Actinidia rufa]|uniref:Sulfate transporter 34 n=1 Tax=Actinidia rufa TaxID=165716 RepID=A0A7J0FZJ0_9ERIC|nr:sulfate transporter 3;4 [Actinidia rufa]